MKNQYFLFLILAFIFTSHPTILFGQEDYIKDPKVIKDVSAQALSKIRNFQGYTLLIADKRYSKEKRKEYILDAIDLFNPNAEIQTASVGKNNKMYNLNKLTPKQYFEKVYKYPDRYSSKLVIHFTETVVDEKIIDLKNGTYKTTATFKQRFDGIKWDGGQYCDVTLKITDILIKPTEYVPGIVSYLVLELGNIEILSIKRCD